MLSRARDRIGRLGLSAVGATALMVALVASPVAGAAWQADLVADRDLTDPAMAVDAAGHVHIAARGRTGIWYLTDAAGGWTRIRLTRDHLHDGNAVSAVSPVIAIDPTTGSLYVAYKVGWDDWFCAGGEMKYVKRVAGGWSSPQAIGGSIAGGPGCVHPSSLAVRDGVIGVASIHGSSVAPAMVYFHTNASGTWTAQRLPQADDETEQNELPTLALDHNGRPRIAYLHSRQAVALYYARGTTVHGDFIVKKVQGGVSFAKPSIALDGDDRPHIAFIADGEARYADRDSTGWHVEDILAATDLVVLGLGPSGRPHVATKSSADGQLWHAARQGAAWTAERVSTAAGLIAIGGISIGNGHAVVSYCIDVDPDPEVPPGGRVWVAQRP